jgi:uncharacterized protein YuzE
MKVTYDPKTDTLTIRLKNEHISGSDELQEGVIVDLNSQGKIVGLEILDASKRTTEPQDMIFESMGHPVAG